LTGDNTDVVTITGSQAQIRAALASSIVYQGDADFSGVDVFTISAVDSAGASDVDTVVISVVSVNDTPVNTVPAVDQTVSEESALVISGVDVADVDGNLSQVVLSVSNGTLDVTAAGGAIVTGDLSGAVTVSGSQADIQATLANHFVYQGVVNFAGTDVLTVSSTDSAGASDVDMVVISVVGVNDSPVITSNGGGDFASVDVDEGVAFVTSVTASDADGDTLTFSVVGGGLMLRYFLLIVVVVC